MLVEPVGTHPLTSRNKCTRNGFNLPDKENDMKVRNSLSSMKKMPGSKVVRRKGRTYVINTLNPRFKTRQG